MNGIRLPPSVRWAAVADTVTGCVATAIAGLLVEGAVAVSVAFGFIVVVSVLGLSALGVHYAERAALALTLPVGVTVYILSMVLVGLSLTVVGGNGLLRRDVIGFAIFAATMIWLSVQTALALRTSRRTSVVASPQALR